MTTKITKSTIIAMDPEQLATLTLAELKQAASKLGVEYTTKTTKGQLVVKIQEARARIERERAEAEKPSAVISPEAVASAVARMAAPTVAKIADELGVKTPKGARIDVRRKLVAKALVKSGRAAEFVSMKRRRATGGGETRVRYTLPEGRRKKATVAEVVAWLEASLDNPVAVTDLRVALKRFAKLTAPEGVDPMSINVAAVTADDLAAYRESLNVSENSRMHYTNRVIKAIALFEQARSAA